MGFRQSCNGCVANTSHISDFHNYAWQYCQDQKMLVTSPTRNLW